MPGCGPPRAAAPTVECDARLPYNRGWRWTVTGLAGHIGPALRAKMMTMRNQRAFYRIRRRRAAGGGGPYGG